MSQTILYAQKGESLSMKKLNQFLNILLTGMLFYLHLFALSAQRGKNMISLGARRTQQETCNFS